MKHNYIQVKFEDYLSYQKKYGHNKLDKWNRIWFPSKDKIISERVFNKIYEEEIFKGLETKYELKTTKTGYLILFKTDFGNEYRFDLFNEPNTNIYDLGFSLSGSSEKEYELLTDKKESLEVFNRLIWILKDITKKIKNRRILYRSDWN